ncbi:uncharacterized protein BDZ99DRAFT_567719 [Mytilinidion resinicola]|uniref:Thioesterase/thiol ester dehydrase-isomerase n=1 Tax=Mytilinidion resinicola TaxID=574789 RepID=A0A6A6YZZ6_9PEZI|nr:uncharacterized protein BDZ99DRAFT_567719 [Mytilinidion resinicola]KAF2814023.1 hypothetical protein BDZ99DRAFT_567719 [Mytilinidion resinicola]
MAEHIIDASGLTLHFSPAQIFIGLAMLTIILLSNGKSLLFMWHVRLLLQLSRHLLFRRRHLTVSSASHGAESLFLPVFTSSYTPLVDLDYNLHKSNSTFFTDLDANRTELMLALFKNVMAPLKQNQTQAKATTLKTKTINLGGTACVFKKPIPPFARYEVSSRLLCWDAKWIYVVSHFTKPGASKPTAFVLGGQAKMERGGGKKREAGDEGVYASAIARYVFKAGRVTVKPEEIIEECGLLPEKEPTEQGESNGKGEGNAGEVGEGHWSREQVMEECRRSLPLAQNFASLDLLHGTRVGGSRPALYAY